MTNPRFTLNDCARAQGTVRIALLAEDGENNFELAFQQAVAEAAERFPGLTDPPPPPPAGRPRVCSSCGTLGETPVTPRRPCTEHREKTWTSPSGNYYVCCAADWCLWGQLLPSGKRRTKHSDGELHEAFEAFDGMPTVEPTSDGEGVTEIEELHVGVSTPAPVAGDEQDEAEWLESEFEETDETD